MPYIAKEDREILHALGGSNASTPGELNYVFTAVIKNYIKKLGLSYQTCNDILGALEGAKLEFYRRVVAPYENNKIQDNGDVYD